MLDGYQNSPKMINEFKQYFIVVISVIFTYNNNANGIFCLRKVFLGGTIPVPVTLDPLVSKNSIAC